MILLFILSLTIRLMVIIPTEFDGLYGQDAYAYYDFGQELRQAVIDGQAPGHFFWPLGYPALLTAGFSLFGVTASTGQVINVILGSALSPLVYVLARQGNLSRSSATLSAVVMTVCGQAIQSSIVVMSDIPALFWATVSAMMMLRYVTKTEVDQAVPRPYSLALASFLLALASVTRWIYLVLFIPWGLAIAARWGWRIRWRSLLMAAGTAGLVFLPQIVYSRTSPAPPLNHAFVNSWSPMNAFLTRFTTVEGHFEYQQINALFYAQTFYEAYYLSPIFTPLLIIGLWRVVPRRRKLNRQDSKTKNLNHRGTEDTETGAGVVIFAGWAILPYLFLVGIPYQNIRFPLIMFPAVAVLVGCGFEWLMAKNRNRRVSMKGITPIHENWNHQDAKYAKTKHLNHRGTENTETGGRVGAIFRADAEISRSATIFRVGVWVVVCSIGIGSIGQTLSAASITISQFITNQQRDKATAAWVAEHVPQGATLYTFGLTLTLRHYTTLDVYELYYETPETLAAKWQRGREDYLLINVWNIENQWKGREPQMDYHWLRDERGLTEVGKMGNYTLFRVGE